MDRVGEDALEGAGRAGRLEPHLLGAEDDGEA